MVKVEYFETEVEAVEFVESLNKDWNEPEIYVSEDSCGNEIWEVHYKK